MPVHERLHIAGDVDDLSSEERPKGLAGDAKGLGESGSEPDYLPLGASRAAAKPTTVAASGGTSSGEIDVTYDASPSGADHMEVVVFSDDGSGAADELLRKEDTADVSGSHTITGLTGGTDYVIRLRSVSAADPAGAPGLFADDVTATATV